MRGALVKVACQEWRASVRPRPHLTPHTEHDPRDGPIRGELMTRKVRALILSGMVGLAGVLGTGATTAQAQGFGPYGPGPSFSLGLGIAVGEPYGYGGGYGGYRRGYGPGYGGYG